MMIWHDQYFDQIISLSGLAQWWWDEGASGKDFHWTLVTTQFGSWQIFGPDITKYLDLASPNIWTEHHQKLGLAIRKYFDLAMPNILNWQKQIFGCAFWNKHLKTKISVYFEYPLKSFILVLVANYFGCQFNNISFFLQLDASRNLDSLPGWGIHRD